MQLYDVTETIALAKGLIIGLPEKEAYAKRSLVERLEDGTFQTLFPFHMKAGEQVALLEGEEKAFIGKLSPVGKPKPNVTPPPPRPEPAEKTGPVDGNGIPKRK